MSRAVTFVLFQLSQADTEKHHRLYRGGVMSNELLRGWGNFSQLWRPENTRQRPTDWLLNEAAIPDSQTAILLCPPTAVRGPLGVSYVKRLIPPIRAPVQCDLTASQRIPLTPLHQAAGFQHVNLIRKKSVQSVTTSKLCDIWTLRVIIKYDFQNVFPFHCQYSTWPKLPLL